MKKIVYFIVSVLLVQITIAANETAKDSTEKTFEFVNKARELLQLSTNPNIILVIGNTGVGKSTMVHYATGNYSKIIAIEPDENSSEYRIYDGLDADIDNTDPSTVSRTLVPEMNVDEEKNVWYDCPGFSDTRNKTVEISGAFLIKTVIENAKTIKAVLLVNYESVTVGHDRQDFDALLTRTIELILNMERFENSVSIVITKAPSYYIKDGMVHEISNQSIKNSTANFMKAHRSVLQQNGSNEEKIRLLDALLTLSSDGDYPRISIFWRPMTAGPLSEIPKMVDGRISIRKTVLEHTSYTNFDENDFGFPLTAEAKLQIVHMAKETINGISSLLQNIDNQLLKASQQKVESIEDFHNRLRLLDVSRKIWQSMNESEAITLAQWTDQLKKSIAVFNITSIDMEDFNRIERHDNNLNILKSIAGLEIAPPVRDLIASSSTANKYQLNEFRWYSFLLQVFNFFSSYETQKDTTAYNVENLSDWGQINKPQGLKITADNFVEFSNRFSGISMSDFTPTLSKLQELEIIINVTLRSPVQYVCNGDTMIVKGNFAKSSMIDPSKCEEKVKKINMFILSTFYADEDITLNGLEEVKIYAPIWSIQRAVAFNLNGLKGIEQAPPTQNGVGGNPGNVGLNSGNFFGFSDQMIDGELLTVILKGGIGGNGQAGTGNVDNSANFQPINDVQKSHNWGSFDSVEKRLSQLFNERGYNWTNADGDAHLIHAKCCGLTGTGGSGKMTFKLEKNDEDNETFDNLKIFHEK